MLLPVEIFRQWKIYLFGKGKCIFLCIYCKGSFDINIFTYTFHLDVCPRFSFTWFYFNWENKHTQREIIADYSHEHFTFFNCSIPPMLQHQYVSNKWVNWRNIFILQTINRVFSLCVLCILRMQRKWNGWISSFAFEVLPWTWISWIRFLHTMAFEPKYYSLQLSSNSRNQLLQSIL